MHQDKFKKLLLDTINNKENSFHPLVLINGNPKIGSGTTIGFFSEINAKGVKVTIGEGCDIASFVAINAADSHKKCIGLQENISRKDIVIENNVFIGSHSVILGGAQIGHHSVIATGSIVREVKIPPFSLVIGDSVKEGYYRSEYIMKNKGLT
jgi:acetyltransferase-like isoleucine patch superfamily enzyme